MLWTVISSFSLFSLLSLISQGQQLLKPKDITDWRGLTELQKKCDGANEIFQECFEIRK